jgi:hypothetical protein
MINEIFKNADMSGNLETEAIELIHNDLYENRIKEYSNSLAIIWQEVEGDLNGELQILVSLDSEFWTMADVVPINNETNSSDTMIYLIDPYVKFIKIKFNKNNIISGNLTAVLSILGAK